MLNFMHANSSPTTGRRGRNHPLAVRLRGKRLWWRVAWVGLGLLVIVAMVFLHRARERIPSGLMNDVRAGLAALNVRDPDERLAKYLELHYGRMSDPVNRRRVFLDFFDRDRIQALEWLVRHTPSDQRQVDILAMAKWIEQYRLSLTPDERAALQAVVHTPEGSLMLQRATAQYNNQDVYYRSQTAPVISQLLKTVGQLQAP